MPKKLARKSTEKGAPTPAYFLSLELKNIRCFGPKQKLDLSDGKGRPAQWTVILCDNGVGKTTLLQALVGLCPIEVELGQGAQPIYANFPFSVR